MDMAEQSGDQDIKAKLQDAIMALEAASAAGREATREIQEQANAPELKALLQQGSERADTWRERLNEALAQMGANPSSTASGNPILDAVQQVGSKIIHKATDPTARDLGIIATGQLALHYYIAAFGTMTAYAKRLGMAEVAGSIHKCLQEAKQGDERYTELAAKIGI